MTFDPELLNSLNATPCQNGPVSGLERIAYARLWGYVLEWRGDTNTNLTAAEKEKVAFEIEARIKLRITAGTLGMGATERELLEDALVAERLKQVPRH